MARNNGKTTTEIEDLQQTNLDEFDPFGSIGTGIIIPEFGAMQIRNDCQTGNWKIGEKEYGPKMEMAVVKQTRYYGNLGKTLNTFWLQLFFVPIAGDLPHNVLCVTYLKKEPMREFQRLVVEVQSKQQNPGKGLFIPTFEKQKMNRHNPQTGLDESVNFYSIRWNWKSLNDNDPNLQSIITTFGKRSAREALIDAEGTAQMVDLSGMTETEINRLVNGRQALLPPGPQNELSLQSEAHLEGEYNSPRE